MATMHCPSGHSWEQAEATAVAAACPVCGSVMTSKTAVVAAATLPPTVQAAPTRGQGPEETVAPPPPPNEAAAETLPPPASAGITGANVAPMTSPALFQEAISDFSEETLAPPPASPQTEETLAPPTSAEIEGDTGPNTRRYVRGDTQERALAVDTQEAGAGHRGRGARVSGPAVPGYVLLGELGRGGMGVVYKARHIGLNRVVALKMILAGGHASSIDLSRFRLEAEAVAKLQHANIVQVYEISEHQGRPFFCLEFVDGGPLDKKLAGNPQAPGDAARLVRKLAQAMNYAHERHIVHRDLKPANILLTADGEPKITDFGLAKKLDDADHLTQSGAIMGTPSYMAPEQAMGLTAAIGPAADTYSLGAILYELLSGRPPFKGTTILDTLEQVRVQETVPPTRLQPKVPRDLETICLKCLQKAPEKRYASAGALADDLGRFLAGEPIEARPTAVWERAWKWARRRPAAAALLAVSVAAVLALTFGGVAYGRMEERRAHEAERLRQAADTQRDRAENNLKSALAAIDQYYNNVSENDLVNEPGAEELRRDLLLAARDYYEKFLRDNEGSPSLKAELAKSLFRLGQIFAEVETPEAGIAYHLRAQKLFESLTNDSKSASGVSADLAATHHHLGRLYRLGGKTELSHKNYQTALQLWDQLPREPKYAAEQGRTQMGLGNLALTKGELGQAADWYGKALATRLRLVEQEPKNDGHRRDLAVNHDNLAAVYDLLGESEKAEKQTRAAETLLRLLAREQPAMTRYRDDLARGYFNQGKRLTLSGDFARARAAYQEAAGIWQSLVRDHPLVPVFQASLAAAQHNEGDLLGGQGEFTLAEQLHAQAMKLRQDLLARYPAVPAHRFSMALGYHQLGDWQRDQSQQEQARKSYQKALELLEKLVADHAGVIDYAAALAGVCNELGLSARSRREHAEAERLFERGVRISDERAAAGKQSPALVLAGCLCRTNLANLDRDRKKLAEARKRYEVAIGGLEKLQREKYRLDRVDPALRSACWGLALTLEAMGEHGGAERFWSQAVVLSPARQRGAVVSDRAVWQIKTAQADLRRSQPGQALAGFSHAIHELETLLRERDFIPNTVATLSNAYAGKAQALGALGQPADAARVWTQLIALEKEYFHAAVPEEAQKRLHLAHWMRAKALTEAGMFPEALDAWDQTVALAERSKQVWFKLYRLDTLARSGAYAEATQEADKLLTELDPDAGTVGVARIFAVAAGVVASDKLLSEAERSSRADTYAGRAMALLQAAEKRGWFMQAANVQRLQQDKSFDALRERMDFRTLLQRVSSMCR